MGWYPEEWDCFFEEEAPDGCPIKIDEDLLEVEFREVASKGAAVVHDVGVADFVEHHEYGCEDAVHEC